MHTIIKIAVVSVLSVFAIVGLVSISKAFGYCNAPIAPEPPGIYAKPTKPMVPFCVNEIMNTHTCDDWQISSYNNELSSYRSDVDYYIQQLKNYISEAEYFVGETVSYAKCEVSTLD